MLNIKQFRFLELIPSKIFFPLVLRMIESNKLKWNGAAA